MFQVDSLKRPSPSPSRSSIRSESRACRQPRVIQVNRDASTMVEGRVPDWEPFSATAPHPPHFRSRTFSDGFIPTASQELLLGVDCDACNALASRRRCLDGHVSRRDLDLVCSCDIKDYNYLNRQPDVADERARNFDIYDIEKIARTGRPRRALTAHHSLDRKHTKNKNAGMSGYISRQLIAYDPANTLVQKIKKNLSNLKKFGGDAITKKHQNAVQLSEFASDSTNSLKKLSMMSLSDRSYQRARKSQSYIFTSSDFHNKTDRCTPTFDQRADRNKNCNFTLERSTPAAFQMRSFENKDDFGTRNTSTCQRKFSTLDSRSRCRSIPRQMSYNDFTIDRSRDNQGTWSCHDEIGVRDNEEENSAPTCMEADLVVLDGSPRATQCRCTCEPEHDKKFSSIFYDYQVSFVYFIFSQNHH